MHADLAAAITRELRAFVAAAGTRRALPTTVPRRAPGGEHVVLPEVDDQGLRADLVERAIDGLAETEGACAWVTRGGDLGTTDADAAWFAAARAGFARHGLLLPAFAGGHPDGWLDLVSGEQRVWRRVRHRGRPAGREDGSERPGVHRLVGVHQLAVLLQGQPQRLGAVGAVLLERGDPVDVPGGAVAAEDAALLDDRRAAGRPRRPRRPSAPGPRGPSAAAGAAPARWRRPRRCPASRPARRCRARRRRGSSPRPPRTTSATTAAGRPRRAMRVSPK